MIPVGKLNPRAVAQLLDYLREEIWRAESERAELEKKWVEFHRIYKALPDVAVRDFPFLGAANFVVPVAATDVDTLYARIMGILFGPENLWSVKPLRPDMILFARRLQEFLQWAQHNELDVYNACANWVLELCKLGTSVLKTRYRREVRRVFQFRESDQGVIAEHADLLLHDHPEISWVSIFNFLVPTLTTTDIQSAPWVSERILQTWGQVQAKVRGNVYDPGGAQRLISWRNRFGPSYQTELLRMDLLQPSFGDQFECRENWLDFDITGVDGPEAIVCTLHMPSMTLLRLDYNPWFSQEKPYAEARFLRQEGRFYGIGLCEMGEPTQDEITTIRRQRIDAATISNAPMMWAKSGLGIKEDEPIIIGRWIIVHDANDIGAVNMGRPIDTTMPHEQTALSYHQRRTGVNDYITGEFSPAMGYSTASIGVQNLRESAKRFDQTMREIRQALSKSGTFSTELYQQFNQNGKEYLAMGPQDGALVHQVLQFPVDMIRAGVGVDVTATSAAFNKEVEIRTNTILLQMLNQFYAQSFQMMQILLSPMTPQPMKVLAWYAINTGQVLLRRILDDYGVQDNDQLVPEMEVLLGGRDQQLQQFGQPGGNWPTPQQQASAGASQLLAPMLQQSGLPGVISGVAGIAGAGPGPAGVGGF